MQATSSLRTTLRKKRSVLPLSVQQTASKRICCQLMQHPSFLHSHQIAGYLASEGEINMHALFEIAWQKNKICYVPIVIKQSLYFVQYERNTPLIRNQWGILEPITYDSLREDPSITIDQSLKLKYQQPNNFDLVLMPLVGFDAQAKRLGRGAGYYDRSFSFLLASPKPTKPYLVGLAYEWQKLKSLISDPWDVPLNMVVTDQSIYYKH